MSRPTVTITNKVTNNPNECVLYLQYTENRIPLKFSLKKRILVTDWVNKDSKFVKDKKMERWLRKQLEKAEAIIDSFEESNRILTFKNFKSIFQGTDMHRKPLSSFFELWDKYEASEVVLRKLEGSTARNRRTTINAFKEFNKNTSFADISEDWLDRFVKHRMGTCKPSSIRIDLSRLSDFIKYATKKAWIKQNPIPAYIEDFNKIHKFKHESKEDLTEKERDDLKNWYLEHKDFLRNFEREVLRSFIVMCYTGLAFSDCQNLKYSDIKEYRHEGKSFKIIQNNRQKTDTTFKIMLHPIVIDIVYERYNGNNEDKVFKKLSLSGFNKKIKILAKRAINTDKNISSHSGRHTFAMLSMEDGIMLGTIQEMLGHSNAQTTQIYAKERSMRRVVLDTVDFWYDDTKQSFFRQDYSENVRQIEKKVIENILLLRKLFGLSASEFAKAYLKNLPLSIISETEKLVTENDDKAQRISFIDVLQIAEKLGLSLQDLMTGTNLYQAVRLSPNDGDGDDHHSDKD